MKPAEEALKALATEVLWQLDLRNLIATPGRTVTPTEKSCKVCALGALYYAHYVIAEPLVDRQTLGGKVVRELVSELADKHAFNSRELRRIELAFERGLGAYTPESEQDSEAIAFGTKYPNKTKRMRAIMQNIIDNNGTFQP